MSLGQDITKAHYEERIAKLEAERDDLTALAERRRIDRHEALSVHTKEGLLASEWVARTGKAEAQVKELKAENATLRDALSDALWRILRGMNNNTVQIRYGDT